MYFITWRAAPSSADTSSKYCGRVATLVVEDRLRLLGVDPVGQKECVAKRRLRQGRDAHRAEGHVHELAVPIAVARAAAEAKRAAGDFVDDQRVDDAEGLVLGVRELDPHVRVHVEDEGGEGARRHRWRHGDAKDDGVEGRRAEHRLAFRFLTRVVVARRDVFVGASRAVDLVVASPNCGGRGEGQARRPCLRFAGCDDRAGGDDVDGVPGCLVDVGAGRHHRRQVDDVIDAGDGLSNQGFVANAAEAHLDAIRPARGGLAARRGCPSPPPAPRSRAAPASRRRSRRCFRRRR